MRAHAAGTDHKTYDMGSCARTLRLLVGPLLLMLVAACAGVGAVPAGRATEVGPGVYMIRGADGEIDAANLGRLGNAGFIVGERGVVAVDAGVSYRHGQALLAEIARVTDKPVRLLVITHARQEFLFGAAAYRERGIPVLMQRRVSRLMTARCDGCLKTLNRVLGEDAMRGTAMFVPDREFDAAETLDLIGRPIRLLSYGHSSGPGDTAVLDMASGVLFAGGLADAARVPDIQDGELPGWRDALAALQRLPLRTVVPGHGPAASPEVLADVQRYLDRLEARLLELSRADVALSEVPDAAELPEFRDWDQYQIIHRRNASILFVRMERELLFK